MRFAVSFPGAGGRKRLTRESSADDICESGCNVKISDVMINRHSWPMFCKNGATKRLYFAKCYGLHPGSF